MKFIKKHWKTGALVAGSAAAGFVFAALTGTGAKLAASLKAKVA